MRRLAIVIGCCLFAACKPATSTQSARDVVVVNTEPRCKKLGTVEGAGGNAEHARADALDQASERGATHIRLERAHPDLEDEVTAVVTGTIYECPPADEMLPPNGYR